MQGTKPRRTVRRERQVVSAAERETSIVGLFLRERERLRRIAAGMGMSRSDADDVLQDVSIRAIRYDGPLDDEAGMRRWLIRTTVNHCLTEHRRRSRQSAERTAKGRADIAGPRSHRSGIPESVGRTEERQIVQDALRQLDPARLSVMVLRYFCDLSSAEIAEITEQNASTVRSQIREARLILAGKLLQRGVEP